MHKPQMLGEDANTNTPQEHLKNSMDTALACATCAQASLSLALQSGIVEPGPAAQPNKTEPTPPPAPVAAPPAQPAPAATPPAPPAPAPAPPAPAPPAPAPPAPV